MNFKHLTLTRIRPDRFLKPVRSVLTLSLTLLSLTACNEVKDDPPIQNKVTTQSRTTAPPILQIDPGGHKSLIRDVTFTKDGRYLVSAGDDKVVRVWDLKTGKTVRTLRGQIGTGPEGKIYAMALSPDERWLAVGGFMGTFTGNKSKEDEEAHKIRLYNFPTGKLVTLLKRHTNVVNSLAFSPNSRYLVSGSADNNAIIWDINKQQPLHTLKGHTKEIYAVAFTPDSKRVVTGSFDHNLRLWRVSNGELIAKLQGHTDKVQSVAINKDSTIASGSWDYSIRLWDGKTGQYIKTLANQGTKVGSLSFSPDGSYLVSGTSGSGKKHCHVWSYPSGKEIVTYKEHDNVVIATAISPNGRWVATGGGNQKEIHIWNLRDGTVKQRLRGVGNSIWTVGFSRDGKQMAWGKNWTQHNPAKGYGPIEYRLRLPTSNRPLGTPKQINPNQNYLRAKDKWQNWSLSHRKGGNSGDDTILDIKNQNRTVASIKRGSTDGYDHRSYTFTPNGETIISGGSNGFLTAYQRNGSKIGDYVGHTGTVWAVAVSADGRFLVSGSLDQTVRLWNVTTRENLLTLFHGSNGEWVVWTPSGHYASSPNGDKMIGWQINKGVDKAADYISAAQLGQHFYRPDIINAAIKLGSAKQAVAQAENTDFNLNMLTRKLPPRFEIISPRSGTRVTKGIVPVKLKIAANTVAIEKFMVYVNGREVTPHKIRKMHPFMQKHKKTIHIPLETGNNRITIRAKNSIGITSAELNLQYAGASQIRQGNLHLVSIGISQYSNLDRQRQLQFAAKDADAIYNLMQTKGKKLYSGIKATLISDNSGTLPTKRNIEQALKQLSKAQKNDTSIIFIAGHGMNIGKDYYLIPRDAKARGSQMDKNSLVSWQQIQNALVNSLGRKILLIDTCHAGNAFNPRLLKDSANQNIIVLSATDADSVSIEMERLGHGVFTYSLLTGLKGDANIFDKNKRQITFNELHSYASFSVKQLTEDRQQIVSQTGFKGFKDFIFMQL
jgi:WD40 repeat protein